MGRNMNIGTELMSFWDGPFTAGRDMVDSREAAEMLRYPFGVDRDTDRIVKNTVGAAFDVFTIRI